MRVTEKFNLPGDVPFLDVHVERDNRLFLDPSAIRNNQADPYAARAHNLLVEFFREVLRCRNSASQADQARGLGLLQNLHEPNETRLGMSATGVAGHAFADELAERLWDQLGASAACRAAAMTRLEDVKLFIEGVGEDLISDLTTRVTFEVLADFTTDMVAQYPSLGANLANVEANVFDPQALNWRTVTINLPDEQPHPLLLVPKHWARPWMLMNTEPFFNRYATNRLQTERETFDAEGRRYAPTKEQLRVEFPDKKALNDEQAAKYIAQDDDLVGKYRSWVDSEYEELSDEEIHRRTS